MGVSVLGSMGLTAIIHLRPSHSLIPDVYEGQLSIRIGDIDAMRDIDLLIPQLNSEILPRHLPPHTLDVSCTTLPLLVLENVEESFSAA